MAAARPNLQIRAGPGGGVGEMKGAEERCTIA